MRQRWRFARAVTLIPGHKKPRFLVARESGAKGEGGELNSTPRERLEL